MRTHSTQPDANIVFYPFKYEDTRSAPKGKEMDVEEISAQDHLIELQTSKSKGGVGSWSVVLDSSKNWKSLLNPGTWALIYTSDQPLTGKEESEPDSGLKMVGIIRSIRRIEQVDPGTATKRVRYLVTGEDFQSVFNTPVYLNANMVEVTQGQSLGQAAALLIFGKNFQNVFTPSTIVKAIVDALLGKPAFEGEKSGGAVTKTPLVSARQGQPYKVPPEVAKRIMGKKASGDFFTGMITFYLQQNLAGSYVNKPEVTGVQSVWSVMDAFCHRIVNEMYTDLIPVNIDGKTRLLPSLVLRSIPFSKKPQKPHASCISMMEAGGAKGATQIVGKRSANGTIQQNRDRKGVSVDSGKGAHFYVSRVISEDEVVGLNVGKSDRERFNFFLVFPNAGNGVTPEKSILESVLRRGVSSVADTASIARYGLRPYITQTPYIANGKTGENFLAINEIVSDMWDKAALYESGQVMLIGAHEHIPVGTNIRFEERGWLAHVEQVDHTFTVSPDGTKSYKTTLTFVRLQMLNGDPVDLTEATEDQDKEGVLFMNDDDGIDRGVTFTKTEKD